MRHGMIVTIEDLRRRACRRLPRAVFVYIDGGAEEEVTLRANRQAFERVQFRPRTRRLRHARSQHHGAGPTPPLPAHPCTRRIGWAVLAEWRDRGRPGGCSLRHDLQPEHCVSRLARRGGRERVRGDTLVFS